MNFLLATTECSSPALGGFLVFVKNVLNIIGIIIPILLIITAAIRIAQIVRNPDDKKGLVRVYTTVVSAVIVFFIPVFVNILMSVLDSNTTISDCWNSSNISESKTYYELNTREKNKVYIDPDEYEKGKPKPKEEFNSNTYNSSETIEGTAKQIGDVVWDPNDVTKISNLTSQQLAAILNDYGGNAKNLIPYASAYITAEHKYNVNVFFLIGIEALESGWGTSAISKGCNNLGGVRESSAHPSNGCGSNSGGGFAYFSSVNEFIDYHASMLNKYYLTPGGDYYNGPTPSGVVVSYCPGCSEWPTAVTTIANELFNSVSKVI